MNTPIILDVEQGTAEWRQARAGFVTASRLSDVMSLTKKGEGCERVNYRAELVCENLTGQPYPKHVTPEMRWGTEKEPEARGAYELQNGILVDRVGFVIHPEVGRFGCSPDALVGDIGMLQIKCPTTKNHLAWMRAGRIPPEHAPQLLGELACNPNRLWIDFMSFDPRLPEDLRSFIRRFERAGHEHLIASMEDIVVAFNVEVDEEIARIPRKAPIADVLDWPSPDEVIQ